MAQIEKKNFASPDETIESVEKQKVDRLVFGDITIDRVTSEPGWKWSVHTKPVVKTESCQKHHLLYIISGKLAARSNDGDEVEFGPGDVAIIPPGHDGWTVGNEPVVWLEIPH